MKTFKWLFILCCIFMITSCGGDDDVNENTGNPRDTPGQNDKTDTDNDGVADEDDQCANTPGDEQADANGCSPSQKDTDNDGVKDDQDQCQETPEDEEVDEQGCSTSQKDTDGDGVNDDEDECPDTPAGADVNEDGCSDAQSDTTAPKVISIEITENSPTHFKVDWRLDEGSQGYIRFGTTPGVYTDSTAKENNYLDRHRQVVGNDNPAPLTPETTYYWQIYVADENGNTGYWEEQSTTTAALPDDDHDGVPNDMDACPDTPEDREVNDQGCHTPDIGEFYEGGFVFYIFEPGDYGYVAGEVHGLVIAPEDAGSTYWASGDQQAVQVFDDWNGYDDGMRNTEKIMEVLQDNNNAAGLCYNLILNGYDDWYLPSVFEGRRLCENLSWPRLMDQELHPDIDQSNLPSDIGWLSNDSEPVMIDTDYVLYQATAIYYDTCAVNEDPEYSKTESSFGVRPIRRF